MADNVSIDYDALTEEIEGQIMSIANSGAFDGLSVEVDQERQFTRRKGVSPNVVYMVVSYGPASVTFGQSVLQATVRCMSEQGTFDAARALLSEFASRYNLKTSGNVTELIKTPEVYGPFNEAWEGFRATMGVGMTIIVRSSSANDVKSLRFSYGGKEEEVPLLSFTESYSNDLRPQPLPGSGGWAKSISGFCSYSFAIATYYDTGLLCKALDYLRYGDNANNNDFQFTLELSTGVKYEKKSFKCASVSIKKEVGAVTYITAAFTL